MVLSKEDRESEGFVIWALVGRDSCYGGVNWFKVND